jgi:hypothetical protein
MIPPHLSQAEPILRNRDSWSSRPGNSTRFVASIQVRKGQQR